MSQDPNAGGAPTNNGVAPTPESAQPQATGAAPIDLNKIDLTSLPQYREIQSKQAQREAQMQRELRETREALAKVQQTQQAQQFANLDKLDPEERAEAYRRQVEQMQAAQAAQAARNQLIQQGTRIIQSAGLQFNDPRLADVLAADPSVESLAAIAERCAAIAAQDKDAAVLAARKAAEDAAARTTQQSQLAAQQARNDALQNAGVPVTSSATPTATLTVSEKDKKIATIRALKNAARNKGADSQEYRAWKEAIFSSGLSAADLG